MRVATILIWLPVADGGNANISLKESMMSKNDTLLCT